MIVVPIVVWAWCSATAIAAIADDAPQQIHLSLGANSFDIVVTWSTMSAIKTTPAVQFRPADQKKPTPVHTVLGTTVPHTSENLIHQKRTQFIHSVRLTAPALRPATDYAYRCGCGATKTPPPPNCWSPWLLVRSGTQSPHSAVHLAVFGDMGVDGSYTLPQLIADTVERRLYDAVLHVGDLAYNMHEKLGRQADEFMRMVEPMAARVPYMVVEGNHESNRNFSEFHGRFRMPGPANAGAGNMFHSFDLGPVHFIGLSSEAYFYTNEYGSERHVRQFEWLERDLRAANRPEARARRPWIVTFAHRPMYCSDRGRDHCHAAQNPVRVGFAGKYGLEPLFWRYGVDLAFWAHEHNYERSWPVYDNRVYNGTTAQPYTDPGAPVHVLTGAAGNREGLDGFRPRLPWTAVQRTSYSYTRMHAYNATHVHLEQMQVAKERPQAPPVRVDSFWLVKRKHGPYGGKPGGSGEL